VQVVGNRPVELAQLLMRDGDVAGHGFHPGRELDIAALRALKDVLRGLVWVEDP